MRNYYDRFNCNETHYRNAVKNIEWNLVKALLAQTPADWHYCSAHFDQREFG
jgi:hypothetical protein